MIWNTTTGLQIVWYQMCSVSLKDYVYFGVAISLKPWKTWKSRGTWNWSRKSRENVFLPAVCYGGYCDSHKI